MSMRELTRDEIVRVSGGRGGNPAPTPTPPLTGFDGMSPMPLDPPPGFTGFGDDVSKAVGFVKLVVAVGWELFKAPPGSGVTKSPLNKSPSIVVPSLICAGAA